MLIPIRLEVDGDVEYARAFSLSAGMADDLREPLRDAGREIIQAVGRQFGSEGSSETGTRWQALNPDYARWKEARYPGRPILVRTAKMRQAALDENRALRVGLRTLTYTVDSDYAIHHQRGDGVPMRRIVALSSASRRSIDRVFAEWVAGIYSGPMWGAAGLLR